MSRHANSTRPAAHDDDERIVTHKVNRKTRKGKVVQVRSEGSMTESDMAQSNGAHKIHISAHAGNIEEVVRILDSGEVNITIPEWSGRQAIHYACIGGHVELVKILLERKARVDALDNSKTFPLFYAASAEMLDTMRLLMERRADPDQLARGKTHCLHAAAGQGMVGSVAYLLDCRASPDVKDAAGVIPAEVAEQDQFQGSPPQRRCANMLRDISRMYKCRSEANRDRVMKERGKNVTGESAVDNFNQGVDLLHRWQGLFPYLTLELTWEKSNCELVFGQYGKCMQSCNAVLKLLADARPRPGEEEIGIDPDTVKKRLEFAKTGMQRLVAAKKAEAEAEAERAAKVAAAAAAKAAEAAAREAAQAALEAEQGYSNGAEAEASVDDGPKPTCVVCLDADAIYVGIACGHLAMCATCRRKAVHLEKGEQGSRRDLSAAQLDRATIGCPVCRVQGNFVRFNGNKWRKGGAEEVYIPLDG